MRIPVEIYSTEEKIADFSEGRWLEVKHMMIMSFFAIDPFSRIASTRREYLVRLIEMQIPIGVRIRIITANGNDAV